MYQSIRILALILFMAALSAAPCARAETVRFSAMPTATLNGGGLLVVQENGETILNSISDTALAARIFSLSAAYTSAYALPSGTTGQRPAAPLNGMIRYNSTTNRFEAYQAGAWVDVIGTGGGGGGTSPYFTPSVSDCSADMTSELEAYLTANPQGAVVKPGTCLWLGDAGAGIRDTVDLNVTCGIAGTCTIEYVNDKNAFLYAPSDTVALADQQTVTSVGTATINKDDAGLPYLTVGSVSGYRSGQWVLIRDSVAVPNDIGSTKTITNVADDGTKCIVTTSTSHGYSSTRKIAIKAVAGTGAVDTIDGADGWGRMYNITSESSTSFSLQTMDNATDTTAGSNVRCTGTYGSGGIAFESATWAGEAARVAAVDTVQKRIYLAAPLAFAPLYVQSPVVYRWTGARKFNVRGFKFRPHGDTSNVALSVFDAAIDVKGVPDAVLQDLTFTDTWGPAVLRRGTPGSIARNIRGDNLPNRVGNDSNTATAITGITVANPAVFTTGSAFGVSDNKDVYLTGMPAGWEAFNDKVCRIDAMTATTFTCADTFGNLLSSTGFSAYTSGATVEEGDINALGYLMSDNGPCARCITDGLYAYEGRHPYTNGTSQLSWVSVPTGTSTIVLSGAPTDFVVENVISYNARGRALDTHEVSARGIFRNWLVEYAHRGDQHGSYEGACGQLRDADAVLENITCRGSKQGIRIVPNDWFKDRTYDFRGITCEQFASADGTDRCIEVGDAGSSASSWKNYTFKPLVSVRDLKTTSVSTPIWIEETANLRLENAWLSDYDDAVICGAGATFEADSVISDHRDPKRVAGWTHKADVASDGHNLVKQLSTVAEGGCKARVGVLSSTQGTGLNKLADVFKEGDTLATKYFWLGKLTEFDPSGVGASSLTSAGATTLSVLPGVRADAVIANVGTPKIVSGMVVKEYGDADTHITEFTFTNVSVSITHAAGTDGYGTLAIYDFPALGIGRGGGRFALSAVGKTGGVDNAASFLVAAGTTSQTAAGTAIVASGDTHYGTGLTVTLSGGVASNVNGVGSGSTGGLNGVTIPRTLYLNVAGVETASSGTITLTGTLRVVWQSF